MIKYCNEQSTEASAEELNNSKHCIGCKTVNSSIVSSESLEREIPVSEIESITPVDPYHMSYNKRANQVTVYQYS